MGYWKEKWKADVLKIAGDEKIEAVVLRLFDEKIDGRILDWDEAEPFMDDGKLFYAWTKTKVLFVGYNEAFDQFWVGSAPRNPVAGVPHHADHWPVGD